MEQDNRFQRTHGVLSPATIQDLSKIHLLIAGVGGAGGQVAIDAARLGFGHLTLADFDIYERHNINRQVGCFESTLGQRKIDVVGQMCRDINPNIRLRLIEDGVTEQNIPDLIAPKDFPAADFVLEVIDIAGIKAKIELHRACREAGITAITGIMLGFGGSLVAFDPTAPGYDKLFTDEQGRLDLRRIIPRWGSYFVKGILEACMDGRGHAPTCVIGATTAASLMISEVMRGIILGKSAMTVWPEYLYVDFVDQVYVREKLPCTP
jgi:molybdopterin/thiamine biosynthesis adenylyltransferase